MRQLFAAIWVVVLAVGAVMYFRPVAGGMLAQPVPLPEFSSRSTADWINSQPLSVHDLRGRVVLLDVWTFDCWNCYRSFPWLRDLEQKFEGKGLQVIGIHTPEFSHEKIRSNVIAKVEEFNLHHPVMLDNEFRYWKALGNRFWPSYYLIDKQGDIRATFVGETHAGDANAKRIEQAIHQLLAE